MSGTRFQRTAGRILGEDTRALPRGTICVPPGPAALASLAREEPRRVGESSPRSPPRSFRSTIGLASSTTSSNSRPSTFDPNDVDVVELDDAAVSEISDWSPPSTRRSTRRPPRGSSSPTRTRAEDAAALAPRRCSLTRRRRRRRLRRRGRAQRVRPDPEEPRRSDRTRCSATTSSAGPALAARRDARSRPAASPPTPVVPSSTTPTCASARRGARFRHVARVLPAGRPAAAFDAARLDERHVPRRRGRPRAARLERYGRAGDAARSRPLDPRGARPPRRRSTSSSPRATASISCAAASTRSKRSRPIRTTTSSSSTTIRSKPESLAYFDDDQVRGHPLPGAVQLRQDREPRRRPLERRLRGHAEQRHGRRHPRLA